MKITRPFFVLFYSFGLLMAGPVIAESTPNEISVTGEARSVMPPDSAIIELTVARDADTARAALYANSTAMQEVLEGLKSAGIEERDLQTSNFAIQPRYVYPQTREGNPPKLVGYTVRNSLTVRVREIEQLGTLLDTAVSLGVNEGGNVSFINEDPSAALEVARTLAVKDALAKAQTLASAAGVKLGEIISLAEHSFTPQPKMARFEAADSMGAAPPVPIVSGENSYHISVSLRVAIEQ